MATIQKTQISWCGPNPEFTLLIILLGKLGASNAFIDMYKDNAMEEYANIILSPNCHYRTRLNDVIRFEITT